MVDFFWESRDLIPVRLVGLGLGLERIARRCGSIKSLSHWGGEPPSHPSTPPRLSLPAPYENLIHRKSSHDPTDIMIIIYKLRLRLLKGSST